LIVDIAWFCMHLTLDRPIQFHETLALRPSGVVQVSAQGSIWAGWQSLPGNGIVVRVGRRCTVQPNDFGLDLPAIGERSARGIGLVSHPYCARFTLSATDQDFLTWLLDTIATDIKRCHYTFASIQNFNGAPQHLF
jgi:hypothetical protein